MNSEETPITKKSPQQSLWYRRLISVLLVIGAVLALIFLLLFIALGTSSGSKFILEKIALETGTSLKYSEGDLRRGVWVTDVKIAQGEDIEILVNKAYVELGWRAIFARQVHLASAKIDKLDIINKKAPTGEPYDYATIDLPVTLLLENATAKTVSYTQKTQAPIYIYNIDVKRAKWSGVDVDADGVSLDFNKQVTINNVIGKIQLKDDYPLSASADIKVTALDDVYVDTLHAKAQGTLKRTHGTVTSKYNNSDVHGSFVAQGLDENSPFSAKLYVDEAVLPYAEDQHITIKDGVITADGVVSRIDLRVNAQLSGRDIPSGNYHGRGVIRDGGMDISQVTANTPSGELVMDGKMSWADKFMMDVSVRGNGYQIRDVLPEEYQDYRAYLPKTLNGVLDFRYYYHDLSNDETRLEFDLAQKDGEMISASLAQSVNNAAAPWVIRANWQNLVRDGVPNLDVIHSPKGNAVVRLEEGRTYIDGNLSVKSLSVAPAGDYDIKANIEKGERVHLTDFRYNGVMGDLAGTGRIDLATANSPLGWRFDLTTKKLIPNAYFDTPETTPFSSIAGKVLATGRMLNDKQGGQIHEIKLENTDLDATLLTGKKISLDGTADANVQLIGSEIKHLSANATAKVGQDILSELGVGDVALSVKGNLNKLDISKLTYVNDSGKLSAAGSIGLNDGVLWDIKARLDEVNTQKFVSNGNLVAKITGDLASTGQYKNEKLTKLTAKFDGQVLNNNLTDGKLSFDINGNQNRLNINHLSHTGSAGDLSLTGMMDIEQLAWQVDAKMNRLNIGKFVKNMDSDLTGALSSKGRWGKHTQEVSISNLDVTGVLREQPFLASGSLFAKLDIPDDFATYFYNLRHVADKPGAIRSNIVRNTEQTRQFIQKLIANNLQVKMGDNLVSMNGTERNLTTALDINELSHIIPSARGVIKGGLILVDDRKELPTVYLDLNAKEVRLANLIVQKANIVGKVVNLGNSPSQVLAEVSDVIAMGKVVKSARIDFKGTQAKHDLAFTTKNAQIEARAKIEGGYDAKAGRYQGVVAEGRMETRFGLLSQKQPAEFSYGINDKSVQIAPHCWQTSQTRAGGIGSLCLDKTLTYNQDRTEAGIVIQNLDTSVLSAVIPSDIFWQSKLNGRAEILSKKGDKNPTINAVLYSDNGKFGVYGDDTGYVEMPYERISVIAKSVAGGLKLRTDIAGAVGEGYADVVVNPFEQNKSISGALVVNDINLAVIRPFFPAIQTMTGSASLQGGLGGTLSKPLFYGNANLSNASLAITDVPLPLSNINMEAKISGTRADLMGEFTGGEGEGEIKGLVDWQNELQAKVHVSADRLAVSKPPLAVAEVSPDLEVVVRPLSRYVDVKGVVSVPSATIRPPDSQSDIVAESADVSVLDRRLTGNVAKVLAVSEPWSINADIGLDLGDAIAFQGFGAKLPLAGALHLTQKGQGSTKARGVIQVSERTKIDGIGQNLELNYAQIRFNGDLLNPRLSIEGEKEIEGRTVGVRVKGTASVPEITVFNDAGLSEQQAMNALVTGRLTETSDSQVSEQSFRSQVTNNLAAAGLSLGLAGTHGITNQIGNALGLESLTIDASGNSSDTNVNVTGYITPDLYIRYGVGVFNAQTELSMRYQLTRRVYVEATSAVENMIDVIYRWKF